MNIQETFTYIEHRQKLVHDYQEMIGQVNQSIKKAALKLLKDQHQLEIGGLYFTHSRFFKLTKIEPRYYEKHISYILTGNSTKKDGSFSKREQFIGILCIDKKGRL